MSRTVAQPWTNLVTYPCDVSAVTADILAQALSMAQSWMFALSGARIGMFTTTDDMYQAECGPRCFFPYKDAQGQWRNGLVGAHDCCRIEIFRQPVNAITQIKLSGVVLDPTGYVLTSNSVRRLDACWPCIDSCEAPIIQLDYTWGVTPEPLALAAAGELACEFINILVGSECKLPSGASQIVRQGVTVTRPNIESILSNGLTGLPIVDAFIRTYNPAGLRQRSRVIRIDGVSVAT